MRHFEEDRRKLKELILYISQQFASKHDFGLTALNKVLYFSDHFAYGKLGEPITGAEYIREKHGPIPRSSFQALLELESEGRLNVKEIPMARGEKILKKPVALVSPDLSSFSKAQIAIVDAILEKLRSRSPRKVRKASHDVKAWRVYKMRETIPYESVFVSTNQRLTAKEIEIGQEIARRRGWLRSAR